MNRRRAPKGEKALSLLLDLGDPTSLPPSCQPLWCILCISGNANGKADDEDVCYWTWGTQPPSLLLASRCGVFCVFQVMQIEKLTMKMFVTGPWGPNLPPSK